ncbi:MAG TPA: phenylalanine--tRNA ligase beta subunit-related protein [Alphaproteobacteria bacterium]|jgi:DNA/RNA-binding domain of Phe-tRNA-synthetase-like protein
MLVVSDRWRAAFPGAHVGVLALSGVANPERHPVLEARKESLTERLRARFAGQDRRAIEALAAIRAYNGYLKPFKKSYHVQLQLESAALKGKPIPSVAALVECMFMAELEDQLLTAGHDLDALGLPLRLEVATGAETYVLMRGEPQQLKAGDMFIADAEGPVSSIVYGPDRRTRITPATRNAIFTVYAPAGIGAAAVEAHLATIRGHVAAFAPDAQVACQEVQAA